MEVTGGAEEGFIREWTPCSHILGLLPLRIHSGIFSTELSLTCVDAITEYIALGTNVGLVYWYDRKKGNIQKLKCETSNSPITYVKIVNTVDYMVGAGNQAGQVSVFQIPKEHPENIPENLKPKVEPKVERYTIGDLHKSAITSIEWSKNGMRLFSGDKNGVIIMTEIDFYMHLCKSMEIVNEQHEIVQMSYCQSALLVSSVYRSIVCERVDGKWVVAQIGKKDRKSLCPLGGVFQYSYGVESRGGAPVAYCARAGLRLWRADRKGNVQHTLLFKEAVANPLTVAELLNPSRHPASPASEPTFGPLHVYREHFLVSHDSRALYVLDPRSLTAVAVVDDLRRILSVSVNKEEIFILEGPRSLIRLAHAPEIAAAQQDEPLKLMTKSLTTTIQHAVNTMRDLTHIDQTVPFIASVLEQPISMFTKTDSTENGIVGDAEECFELPPIKQLPNDISGNVLESIVNEFKDVSSEVEEIRRAKSEELQKKLKLYNSIMEKKFDVELIHSSRRSKRREGSSGTSTPRVSTPVRKPIENVSYTSPCVMNMSIYSDSPQNDDLLEKQIEENERKLAKMLNLESLSIKTPKVEVDEVTSEKDHSTPTYLHIIDNNRPAIVYNNQIKKPILNNKLIVNDKQLVNDKPLVTDKPMISEMNAADLVPKIVKLPNTWNLEDIELELDIKGNPGNYSRHLSSPDDHLDSEWEII